ncbi:MAG TPA: HAD-IA family hydrolase [Gaiellaceae bacterium]|nr:HAD-IA family hydrolase [Gaiellaceae bacterium]
MSSEPSASDLDAVTVDAMGTMVELEDPAPRLQASLAERGVERGLDRVAAAFRAEVAYYLPRTLEGRDEPSLADLGRRCTAVFLEHAGADLDAAEFAPAFLAAIVFRPLPGAAEALARLRDAGLTLVCVSNWDISLGRHLEEAGLAGFFTAIVSSAEAGVAKPEAAVFWIALDRVGVQPERALHIGDGDNDSDGAAAAGLAFAPVPLATLPERLGLGRRP